MLRWIQVCPESIRPCTMKNRDISPMKNRDIYWRWYKTQETLYTGKGCLSSFQGRHPGTSQFSQLPCHIFLTLIRFEISFLSKVVLVLGKARSHRAPDLGCRGTESPGWFDVSPKNCRRHDAWAGVLSWLAANQSPVAHSCSLLNHLKSFHKRNIQA